MKTALKFGFVLGLSLAFAALAVAGEEPKALVGKIVCGKCTLKKADVRKCQDVLVVEGEGAGEYWIEKNSVAKEFGHVCDGEKRAKVKGAVEDRGGVTWIVPTAMEEVKE
jgi:hypothetical protein